MSSTAVITIRLATSDDDGALRRLAELDSRRPLIGPVLVAEDAGRLVAAVSPEDGRAIADPFVASAGAVELLRVRAAALAGRDVRVSRFERARAALRLPGRTAIPQN